MANAFLSLVRLTDFNGFFLDYITIVAVVVVSGKDVTTKVDMTLLLVMLFSLFALMFAFVVNDLSDATADMLNAKTRNPLARGEMSKRTATFIAIMFLAVSVFLLMLLPFRIIPLGIAGLLLSSTYSWGIRAKFRPLLDVIYHASMCTLPFVMGYLLYRPFDENCLLGSFAICTTGALAELMQELRDYDFDDAWGKTSATVLGKKKSLASCLVLIFVSVFLVYIIIDRTLFFSFNILGLNVPFQLVLLPPFSLILMKPLVSGMSREESQESVYKRFRKRKLVIFTVVLFSSVALIVYTSQNSLDIAINTKNYSFDLELRTLVAGRKDSDVPWIMFDYVDQNNFYYLILHTNSILELGHTVDGQYEGYITSVKTSRNPFQSNEFHISLNETTILITLDNQYELVAPRTLPDSATFEIRIQSSDLYSYIGSVALTNLHQNMS